MNLFTLKSTREKIVSWRHLCWTRITEQKVFFARSQRRAQHPGPEMPPSADEAPLIMRNLMPL